MTPAIVLQTFPYSETSLVVRLATRDVGVQSAIAKGARRARSAFGAGLALFSEGAARLHVRDHRDLQTLSGFDAEQLRLGLTRGLERFASASAIAEVVRYCGSGAPHLGAYEVLREGLDRLVAAADHVVAAASLGALWDLVTALGFAPSLNTCARDGATVAPSGAVAFSAQEGGVLCDRCAEGREVSRLGGEDFRDLVSLVTGADLARALPARHARAHRRLVARFIRCHLSEDRTFEALAYWERGPWNGTSS